MKLFVLVWNNRITSTNQHGSVNETMTIQTKQMHRQNLLPGKNTNIFNIFNDEFYIWQEVFLTQTAFHFRLPRWIRLTFIKTSSSLAQNIPKFVRIYLRFRSSYSTAFHCHTTLGNLLWISLPFPARNRGICVRVNAETRTMIFWKCFCISLTKLVRLNFYISIVALKETSSRVFHNLTLFSF